MGSQVRATIWGWRAAAAVLLLAACGRGGPSGTYEDEAAMTQYTFRPDGTVQLSVLGANVPAEYVLDGDKVVITSPQGTIVFRRHDDRLIGPMGLELRQRAD